MRVVEASIRRCTADLPLLLEVYHSIICLNAIRIRPMLLAIEQSTTAERFEPRNYRLINDIKPKPASDLMCPMWAICSMRDYGTVGSI